MSIEQQITMAKVSLSEFLPTFESKSNRITNLLHSTIAGFSTYSKIMKDLFVSQEAKWEFVLAWITESYDNVVENLSSKEHLT
jgi:hypothetical protein